MKTTVNKDGSVTTSAEDEHDTSGTAVVTTAKVASGAESKVVESDDKPAAKTRSKAESK